MGFWNWITSFTKDEWVIAIQAIATVIIALTFLIYLFQLRAMQRQVAIAREAGRATMLMSIHNFMLDESFRAARRSLINIDEAKRPLSEWTKEDRSNAERVSARYNFLALLVSRGAVSLDEIEDLRYSMTKCHRAARELLAEVRTLRDPKLWHHFTDVVARFESTPTQ